MRFAGLDGVSLEAAKVAAALRAGGHESVWFAGELGPEFSPGLEVPAAHFATKSNRELEDACFGRARSGPGVREAVDTRAAVLETALDRFIDDFGVEVLLVHNALSIPMQLPLGLALTRVIERSGIRAICHHHDFGWERPRFAHCAVPDILESSFPPTLSNLSHVVINRDAREQLQLRRGVDAVVLPNVMDFAHPPVPGNGSAYRAAAGIGEEDVVLLQPTRIIPRKGIELTIRLAAALGNPNVRVVVSHADDRDETYWSELVQLSTRLDVDLRLASGGRDAAGLADAYDAADLVCFPSRIEGFGNALLEAFYYRKPVFVNRYPVYVRDIVPTGVRCIEADGEITERVLREAEGWLADRSQATAAAANNYAVGEQHYSYDVVRSRIGPLLVG
jgi:glycosyltransferase involved in cell wall biosynthesis